ncbi:MAG: hypothetical protein DVB31_00315 [Verrucomicrobia bacterium]|nr:MAG: hypothetical protein DVB31_00315 [Verrucomicrobiota bacterium]
MNPDESSRPHMRGRWVALACCAALWLGVESIRTRRSPPPDNPPIDRPPGRAEVSEDPLQAWVRRPTGLPARVVRDYNQSTVADIVASADPAALAVLMAVTNALPPGWEDGFALHDCLVAVAALTDVARLESPALVGIDDASASGPDPAATSGREGSSCHGFLREFFARWLARKHPALGEHTIRRLLLENTLAQNPALGAYDLIPIEDSIRLLGIPVPPASPRIAIEVPEEVRHRYRATPGTP